MKKETKVKVSHTLSKGLYDALDKTANDLQVNRSKLIELIIKEWFLLKKEKEEREAYDKQ